MPGPSHFQLLDRLARSGPMTRAALGEQLGLGKAAISGLTRDLLDQGLIRPADRITGPGRPSTLLALAAEGGFFIGISLLTDPARMVLCDFLGQPRAETTLPRTARAEDMVAKISAALPGLIAQATCKNSRVLALSVTLSAHVDPAQKHCLRSGLLGWQDVPLAAMLTAATGITSHIENDAKAMAIAESLNPDHAGRSLSLIWLDQGIGAAHFLDGRLWRGAHGAAGEIAHLVADPAGLPCACGRRGCLDTLATTVALAGHAQAIGYSGDFGELDRLAHAGNPAARAILHRAAEALGRAITLNQCLIDPAQVLVIHADPAYSGYFAHILHQTAETQPITFKQVGPGDWAMAAARLATHNYLKNIA